MTTHRIRLGVIGANVSYGWTPRAHMPAIRNMPDFELAAVCTAHEETARESAETFGVPLAFHDHREMLRQADLDAVAVVVRVPAHHRLTMDALDAGKHVYTEWPLGANLQEAKEMADLARGKGVHTMVGLQTRCSPAFLTLKELHRRWICGRGTVLPSGPICLRCSHQDVGPHLAERSDARRHNSDDIVRPRHRCDLHASRRIPRGSAVVRTRVTQWHETDTGRMVDVTAPDNILVSGTLSGGAVASAHVSSVPCMEAGTGWRCMAAREP